MSLNQAAVCFATGCLAVSDPESPAYGRHWTLDEVANKIDLSASSQVIVSLLRTHGVPRHLISETRSRDFVHATVSVAQAEALFATEIFMFHSDLYPNSLVKPLLRALHYSLPVSVAPHVAFVAGLTRLPRLERAATRVDNNRSPFTRRLYRAASAPDAIEVNPGWLLKTYNVSLPAFQPNNSAAVAEFPYLGAPEYYVDSDMQQFLYMNNLPASSAVLKGKLPLALAPLRHLGTHVVVDVFVSLYREMPIYQSSVRSASKIDAGSLCSILSFWLESATPPPRSGSLALTAHSSPL